MRERKNEERKEKARKRAREWEREKREREIERQTLGSLLLVAPLGSQGGLLVCVLQGSQSLLKIVLPELALLVHDEVHAFSARREDEMLERGGPELGVHHVHGLQPQRQKKQAREKKRQTR